MLQEDLDKYAAWIKAGESFSKVREDLQKRNYPESEIKDLILKIDEITLHAAFKNQNGIQSRLLLFVGFMFLICGIAVGVTMRSSLGIQAYMGPLSFLWIVITPIATGTSLIVMGMKPKKSPADRRKFKARS